jgi:hypothetical protein
LLDSGVDLRLQDEEFVTEDFAWDSTAGGGVTADINDDIAAIVYGICGSGVGQSRLLHKLFLELKDSLNPLPGRRDLEFSVVVIVLFLSLIPNFVFITLLVVSICFVAIIKNGLKPSLLESAGNLNH